MELKREGCLIYARDGDGWTVVASTLACTGLDAELAQLFASAPEVKRQRDELLKAGQAVHDWLDCFLRCQEETYSGEEKVLADLRTAIANAKATDD